MAVSYLADTSVLTRLAQAPVREEVRRLLGSTRVSRCAMTDLELGFSARNVDEWEKVRTATNIFDPVDVVAEDFRTATMTQRALAAAGLKGRKVPDLLIAAVAARMRLTVLHYDHDFEYIARVTGQQEKWVVPAGSID